MKTSFFLIFTAIILSVCCFRITAQDYTQFSLPEGAKARLGKGTLGEIRFSPDGSRLAVSSSVGVWFYDPQTGNELDLLPQTDCAATFALAYLPHGNTIARAIDDSKIQLWNVVTKRHIGTLTKYGRSITSIAYSPDGTTIVSGNSDGAVRVWDAETYQRRGTLSGHSSAVTSVAYSLDGTVIATGGGWGYSGVRRKRRDDTARLWNANTGKRIATLAGHTDSVNALAFSPDSTMIATASSDTTIRLWNTNTGDIKTILIGHTDDVNSVIYSPDGRMIVSASSDDTVRLWNADSGEHKATLKGHTGAVTSVAYSPDGNTLATASGGKYGNDNTVRLWDANTGETKAILTGHNRVNSVVYSPTEELRLWVVEPTKLQDTSADGNTRATAGDSDTIQLSDTRTGKRKTTLRHTNAIDWIYMMITDREYGIEALAFSPDGNTIVTGGGYYTHDEGTVYLWHARTGKRKTIYKGPGYVSAVAFSPDGRTIAAGNWEDEIQLWHAVTGEKLKKIPTKHIGGVGSLVYSPDGKTLTTGGGHNDKRVYMFDADTGALKTTLIGHTGGVTSIMYSPDGRTVATGGRYGTVRLWDADIGKHIMTFTAHTEVTSVMYFPDGNTIVSGHADGTVLLWDVTSIRQVE
ncbi:PQQ-binding-like beta-propeller repeat protein [Candidatus Poribacteria bacterium]|nr:PQQ-binding-like beta-propeller repeat protein [Candidatus Poribacteria bacterium]MYA98163.1 PQQ-binding-like beta-propeller repeat protein [Candidatus Poribacteria bacterium]